MRYVATADSVQRWLCRDCGYRFTDPKALRKNQDCHINTANTIVSSSQVCDLLTEESKNLTETTRQETASREGTKQALDIKGKIIEFLWHLERENKKSKTIVTYRKYLTRLVNISANLFDPESVKDAITRQKSWGENSKRMATEVYKSFAAFSNLHFEPPRYKARSPLPFIPLESELDALIAGSNKRLSACLQLLKEIPIRIGEALSLKWIEIDSERRIIYVNTTEKDGKPRVFKISEKLLGMINALPKKNEKIFGLTGYQYISSQLATTRKRIANKLQNPRLLQIHFHTFRHWKATMEYNRTRDILYVMRLLGHRCIENTLVYTQLVSFENDQYHSAVAKTVAEAQKLVEQGFEFVCQIDGATLFRKRK